MRLNLSIKNKLIYVSVGLFIILLFIQILTGTYFKKIADLHDYSKKIDVLRILNLQLRSAEKDFLTREVINPLFFTTGESKYLNDFDSYIKESESILSELMVHPFSGKQDINQDIIVLQSYLQEYYDNFNNLSRAIKNKGFKDYGLVGEMRNAIHRVEKALNDLSGATHLSVSMLMLRRHEKDYLLRKDLKYKEKFNHEMTVFKTKLSGFDTDVNNLKIYQLIDLLDEYQKSFSTIIEIDKTIGLNPDDGLQGKLNASVRLFESKVNSLVEITEKKVHRDINRAIWNLLSIIFLIAVLFLVVLMLISKSIIKPIKRIRDNIFKISEGNIKDNIFIYNRKDEIGEMVDALKNLTTNLYQKYRFALKIGKGDLTAHLSILGKKDIFGESLITMKQNLLNARKREEERMKEEKTKTWLNEGLAKMSQVLQSSNDNIDDFAYHVIKNLVRYVKAIQGGLFLINKENKNEIFLELKSCFAYDRRKYISKKVPLGEGLLSACYLEKEKIYITNLPDNYMEITSGLGSSVPRSLLIVPLKTKEDIIGVMEIASLSTLEDYKIEFIENIAENIATNISSVIINTKTSYLLKLSKEQSEELRQKEEELEQNMEEMRASGEMSEIVIKELKSKLKKAEKEISELKNE